MLFQIGLKTRRWFTWLRHWFMGWGVEKKKRFKNLRTLTSLTLIKSAHYLPLLNWPVPHLTKNPSPSAI